MNITTSFTSSIVSTRTKVSTPGSGNNNIPLIDEEAANYMGRRTMMMLDVGMRGYLEPHEVLNLLRETYKMIGKVYEPTQEELQETMKRMDLNQDGKVSASDIEGLALKYLLKPTAKA